MKRADAPEANAPDAVHAAVPMEIRRARASDAEAIGRIYDEGIAGGIATFAHGVHDGPERAAWLAARSPRAPVWCGLIDQRVVAWSALAPFSHRPWYDGVGEYTVYVAPDQGGRGIGRRMLRRLIADAPAFDYWKLVGMILQGNAAGLALALGAGFRVVGTHVAHARHGDAWRDVTVVERNLTVRADQARESR